MTTVKELKEWLDIIYEDYPDGFVSVDDGGLTLLVTGETGSADSYTPYFEVGGTP